MDRLKSPLRCDTDLPAGHAQDTLCGSPEQSKSNSSVSSMDSPLTPTSSCLADRIKEMKGLYDQRLRDHKPVIIPEWYQESTQRYQFFLEVIKTATTDFLDFLHELGPSLFQVHAGFHDEATFLWLNRHYYIKQSVATLCHAATIGLATPFAYDLLASYVRDAPQDVFIAACQGGNVEIFQFAFEYTKELCDASMGALGFYGHYDCILALCKEIRYVPMACLE